MDPVSAVAVWLTTIVLAGPHSCTAQRGLVHSAAVGIAPTR